MAIAIYTRILIKNKLEGIGHFSFEILKWITNDLVTSAAKENTKTKDNLPVYWQNKSKRFLPKNNPLILIDLLKIRNN